MPSKTEVAELIGHIRATKKFKVVSDSRHHKVMSPEGQLVTTLPKTPSDHRWRKNAVSELIRQGVLESDPFGKAKAKTNGGGSRKGSPLAINSDPELKRRIHEAKVAAIHAKSEKQREMTAQVRLRLEPIIVLLGGWKARGGGISGVGPSDLSNVAFAWGRARGRVELPKTSRRGSKPIEAVDLRSSAQSLRDGGTLGDVWLPFWTVFVDDLWAKAGDDPRRALDRYRELERQAKGIPPVVGPGSLEPEPDEAEPEQEFERLGPAHGAAPLSELVLRVVYWAGRGGAELADALALGQEIEKLGDS